MDMPGNPRPCYCGHDCARCTVYRATILDSDALRERARAFYYEAFDLEVPLSGVRCLGGRSEAPFFLCGGCPWARCCRERGIEACADCADYPCPRLAAYADTYVNRCLQEDTP